VSSDSFPISKCGEGRINEGIITDRVPHSFAAVAGGSYRNLSITQVSSRMSSFGEESNAVTQSPSIAENIPDASSTAGTTTQVTATEAWNTINNMLIQNRCWLCQAHFQKGKIKKVFMVSQLLDHFEKRLALLEPATEPVGKTTATAQSIGNSSEVVQDTGTSSEPSQVVQGEKGGGEEAFYYPMNMQQCFDTFVMLGGKIEKLMPVFTELDIAPWMSGLICSQTPECVLYHNLISSSNVKESLNAIKAEMASKGFTIYNECPPGCGCDNPWSFLPSSK
jgi:hypothetical protein